MIHLLTTAARERQTSGFISSTTWGRLTAAGITAVHVERFITTWRG